MEIRLYRPTDHSKLVQFVAEFRIEITLLKNITTKLDLKSAKNELDEYISEKHPIFVCEDNDNLTGFLICRVDDTVVWAEQLYVSPNVRRKGVASALYSRAEKLAEELGGETTFNWVHPNNDGIIGFLKKHGYSVLNLIEIRKPWKDETSTQRITVGKHEFDY